MCTERQTGRNRAHASGFDLQTPRPNPNHRKLMQQNDQQPFAGLDVMQVHVGRLQHNPCRSWCDVRERLVPLGVSDEIFAFHDDGVVRASEHVGTVRTFGRDTDQRASSAQSRIAMGAR